MIERPARVIRVELDLAWISPERGANCTGCTGICQNHSIWRWFCKQDISFSVHNTLGVREGEKVFVGITDQALIKCSILLYVLPMMLLIVGACVGRFVDARMWQSAHEWFSIAGGLSGFILGFGLATKIASMPSQVSALQPVLLRRTVEIGEKEASA